MGINGEIISGRYTKPVCRNIFMQLYLVL